MEMAPGALPRPGRVPEQRLLSPEIRWRRRRSYETLSEKLRWEHISRPTSLRGLGVLDLHKFSRALRLRWLWYEWKDLNRAWVGKPL
jgi:hypothetical protein